MMLMTLEPIIHSKVSQKEKDKYHILTHIYGIQENGSEEFTYRAAVEKWTWRVDLGEREEEGEMYEKSNMETYSTMCRKNVQW